MLVLLVGVLVGPDLGLAGQELRLHLAPHQGQHGVRRHGPPPVAIVEAAVADTLRTVLERPDVIDALLGALRAELKAQMPTRKTNVAALQKEVTALRREQENLIAVAAAGAQQVPQLASALQERATRIQALEAQLAVARRTPDEAAAMLVRAERTLRTRILDLRKVLAANPDDTRELYQGLFPGGLVWEADKTSRPTDGSSGGRQIYKAVGDPNGPATNRGQNSLFLAAIFVRARTGRHGPRTRAHHQPIRAPPVSAAGRFVNRRPMDFTGRAMNGYVFVERGGIRTEKAVKRWGDQGADFVATLARRAAKKRQTARATLLRRPAQIGYVGRRRS